MKSFKILGSGCKKCTQTADMIATKAEQLNIQIELEKITDMSEILSFGVITTPGVVLDETVVHAGGLPSNSDIETWLKN